MSKKTTTGSQTQHDVDLGQVYTRTELFLEKNKKAVTIGTVALIAVVAVVLGYRKFVAEPNALAASELMWKAEYWFEIDSLDRALQGDNEYPGFELIAQEYGSTPSGNLAHYYMGSILMRKGEYEAAIAEFEQADVDDEMLRAVAIGTTGDALVELGRTGEAVGKFEKAANLLVNEFSTPLYLMKAAILHEEAGNWKAAVANYERIVKEFPTSNEASQARKFAGKAGVMAAQ